MSSSASIFLIDIVIWVAAFVNVEDPVGRVPAERFGSNGSLDPTAPYGVTYPMDITLVTEPSDEEIRFVRGNLRTYNTRHLESRDERRYAAFSTDDIGARTGGIVFTEFGNWLEIDYLWVDEARRGRGIGSRLLREALDHARNRGCTHALTNTYSFQALPFYRTFGFEVVFEQQNYPIHSSRYFITVEL